MTLKAFVDVENRCCVVFMGTRQKWFVVLMGYLEMTVFQQLLETVQWEFSYMYNLQVPC
jgi:hypothetical protein